MDIYFGYAFDEKVLARQEERAAQEWYGGPGDLLQLLERHYGLDGHPGNNEFLRAEQYRQTLSAFLRERDHGRDGECWFQKAFEADALATAVTLLEMRDELILAGWTPSGRFTEGRLSTFAELEEIAHTKNGAVSAPPCLDPGFADRFRAVIRLVPQRRLPFSRFWHLEPKELYPAHINELLEALEKRGVTIRRIEAAAPLDGDSDLARFQRALAHPESSTQSFSGDGSLVTICADRESDAALFLAALLRLNPDFRPACLVPEKNRALENALLQEGHPAMGILSASLARPSLQILKLLPVFFWDPADPYKILEFLSLPTKPLHPQLAREIAALISQRPGLGSGRWKKVVDTFFKQLQEKPVAPSQLKSMRNQYRRWFERRRYALYEQVPREDVIECFGYVAQWAREAYENNPQRNPTFLALSSQSKRVCELLRSLPEEESRLTPLQLERIIRTIYEPSPVQFSPTEVGSLPFAYRPGAIMADYDHLVWWNFCRHDPQVPFSRWKKNEVESLAQAGIHLTLPAHSNKLDLWHSHQPVLRARKRLYLFIPAQLNGEEVSPHALNDFLEARFSNPEVITASVTDPQSRPINQLTLPQLGVRNTVIPEPPTPWIQLDNKPEPDPERHEFLTQVSNLCYYPHQWVFNRHVKLHKSPILSVARDNTLNGNLGHRLLELLFEHEDVMAWDRQQLDGWIEDSGKRLLPREGATLLMYGKEPERRAFFRTMKNAAWSLLHHLRSNGWRVVAAEQDIHGQIGAIPFKGRADLVLERKDEHLIVDYKWRGFNYFRDMLRNEEDLQMVLYSKFHGDPFKWAHTAYFILDGGRMLAHNKNAIAEAETPNQEVSIEEVYPRILERINRTLQWRMDQFQDGFLEIRSAATTRELEAYYQDQLMDLLEMKADDAPFDDYLTLVNGVHGGQ